MTGAPGAFLPRPNRETAAARNSANSVPPMAFDLAAAFNNYVDRVANSQLLGGVFRNPVLSALALTAVVYAIFYAFRGSKHPGRRFATWAGLSIAAFLFLHYQVVDARCQAKYRDAAATSTISSIVDGRGQAARVPTVVPRSQGAIFTGGHGARGPPPRAAEDPPRAPAAPARAPAPAAPRGIGHDLDRILNFAD